ncbi:hypothetical protein [Ralstonia sp. ASV6]|uniref:hypothetical protein n=1 Tax=Ralstonia sp. ASV6 TaxID=2795124 RepID=UPI0018EBD1FF|nr:hypothetical protein [Ralstonia sp. ASV6]
MSNEEVIAALVSLGEDPSAGRVEAVRAFVNVQGFRVGSSDQAKRLAVDAMRRQVETLPQMLAGMGYSVELAKSAADQYVWSVQARHTIFPKAKVYADGKYPNQEQAWAAAFGDALAWGAIRMKSGVAVPQHDVDVLEPKAQFIARVTDTLVSCGWQAKDGTAIASRAFDTAVGKKEAVVYLVGFGGEDVYQLQGEYYSEGRNALEPHCVRISKHDDASTTVDLVRRFSDNAVKIVGQTYAARLYDGGEVANAGSTNGRPKEPDMLFKAVNVTGEWFDGDVSIPAYTCGLLWNGFQQPYFPRASVQMIAELMPDEVEFDVSNNVVRIKDEGEEVAIEKATHIEVDGQRVEVFSVGSSGWCWEKVSLAFAAENDLTDGAKESPEIVVFILPTQEDISQARNGVRPDNMLERKFATQNELRAYQEGIGAVEDEFDEIDGLNVVGSKVTFTRETDITADADIVEFVFSSPAEAEACRQGIDDALGLKGPLIVGAGNHLFPMLQQMMSKVDQAASQVSEGKSINDLAEPSLDL